MGPSAPYGVLECFFVVLSSCLLDFLGAFSRNSQRPFFLTRQCCLDFHLASLTQSTNINGNLFSHEKGFWHSRKLNRSPPIPKASAYASRPRHLRLIYSSHLPSIKVNLFVFIFRTVFHFWFCSTTSFQSLYMSRLSFKNSSEVYFLLGTWIFMTKPQIRYQQLLFLTLENRAEIHQS